jgi:hypothetical protein
MEGSVTVRAAGKDVVVEAGGRFDDRCRTWSKEDDVMMKSTADFIQVDGVDQYSSCTSHSGAGAGQSVFNPSGVAVEGSRLLLFGYHLDGNMRGYDERREAHLLDLEKLSPQLELALHGPEITVETRILAASQENQQMAVKEWVVYDSWVDQQGKPIGGGSVDCGYAGMKDRPLQGVRLAVWDVSAGYRKQQDVFTIYAPSYEAKGCTSPEASAQALANAKAKFSELGLDISAPAKAATVPGYGSPDLLLSDGSKIYPDAGFVSDGHVWWLEQHRYVGQTPIEK